MYSSTDNSLYGRGRAIEKSGILLQIKKAAAHLATSNSSKILTIEK